jgi:hypothetical protein
MEGGSGSAMRDVMQAHKSRRSSSGHKKRSSLQGMVSNTKSLLGGRFGDAFRRKSLPVLRCCRSNPLFLLAEPPSLELAANFRT